MGRLLRLRSIRQSTCNTAEISFGLSSSFAANQTQLAATLCKRNPKRWRLGLQNNDKLLLFEWTSFQVLKSTKERSSRKLNDKKARELSSQELYLDIEAGEWLLAIETMKKHLPCSHHRLRPIHRWSRKVTKLEIQTLNKGLYRKFQMKASKR